jgi:hypothetical protein
MTEETAKRIAAALEGVRFWLAWLPFLFGGVIGAIIGHH